jgi:hypothetical protein
MDNYKSFYNLSGGRHRVSEDIVGGDETKPSFVSNVSLLLRQYRTGRPVAC